MIFMNSAPAMTNDQLYSTNLQMLKIETIHGQVSRLFPQNSPLQTICFSRISTNNNYIAEQLISISASKNQVCRVKTNVYLFT